jgi:hypothetical protein
MTGTILVAVVGLAGIVVTFFAPTWTTTKLERRREKREYRRASRLIARELTAISEAAARLSAARVVQVWSFPYSLGRKAALLHVRRFPARTPRSPRSRRRLACRWTESRGITRSLHDAADYAQRQLSCYRLRDRRRRSAQTAETPYASTGPSNPSRTGRISIFQHLQVSKLRCACKSRFLAART